MKKVLSGIIIIFILVVFGSVLFPQKAEAIPAFSRKYKTSCVTCHAPFPKLTAFGEAFRQNGYKIPEDEELYIKDEPVSLGADAYKKVFPAAIWPSDIPGMPPLSILVKGEVDIDTGGTKDNRADFIFPQELSLLGAGAFGGDFSFFTEIEYEKEDNETDTEIAAWLMWEDLFSGLLGNNHLNIRAGTVGMQDIALPENRGHNRISREDYLYIQELDLKDEPGFEINGFGRVWRYYFGVVDSNRTNNEKDPYAGFALKFGGLGFDGSGNVSEEGLTTTPSGYWRDDSIRFGFFAYRSHTGKKGDRLDRYGGDVRGNYKDLSISGGYIRGNDDSDNTDKDLWFVEAEYFLFPWWIAYSRFETLSVDGANNENLARFIPGMAFLIRANIKATLEGRFYTENEPAAKNGNTKDDDRVVFNLTWAF